MTERNGELRNDEVFRGKPTEIAAEEESLEPLVPTGLQEEERHLF